MQQRGLAWITCIVPKMRSIDGPQRFAGKSSYEKTSHPLGDSRLQQVGVNGSGTICASFLFV